MECREFEERVSIFMDGEMEHEECLAWERHLESCARCRKLLEDFRSVDSIVKAIPSDSPEMMNPFDLIREKSGARVWKPWILRFSTAFAILLIAAGLIFFFNAPFFIPVHSPTPGGSSSETITEAPAFKYNIQLNDSKYSVSLWGEEVQMLSFRLTENDSSSVSLKFDSK